MTCYCSGYVLCFVGREDLKLSKGEALFIISLFPFTYGYGTLKWIEFRWVCKLYLVVSNIKLCKDVAQLLESEHCL